MFLSFVLSMFSIVHGSMAFLQPIAVFGHNIANIYFLWTKQECIKFALEEMISFEKLEQTCFKLENPKKHLIFHILRNVFSIFAITIGNILFVGSHPQAKSGFYMLFFYAAVILNFIVQILNFGTILMLRAMHKSYIQPHLSDDSLLEIYCHFKDLCKYFCEAFGVFLLLEFFSNFVVMSMAIYYNIHTLLYANITLGGYISLTASNLWYLSIIVYSDFLKIYILHEISQKQLELEEIICSKTRLTNNYKNASF